MEASRLRQPGGKCRRLWDLFRGKRQKSLQEGTADLGTPEIRDDTEAATRHSQLLEVMGPSTIGTMEAHLEGTVQAREGGKQAIEAETAAEVEALNVDIQATKSQLQGQMQALEAKQEITAQEAQAALRGLRTELQQLSQERARQHAALRQAIQDMTVRQQSDAQERQALQARCNTLQQQLTEGTAREGALRATIQELEARVASLASAAALHAHHDQLQQQAQLELIRMQAQLQEAVKALASQAQHHSKRSRRAFKVHRRRSAALLRTSQLQRAEADAAKVTALLERERRDRRDLQQSLLMATAALAGHKTQGAEQAATAISRELHSLVEAVQQQGSTSAALQRSLEDLVQLWKAHMDSAAAGAASRGVTVQPATTVQGGSPPAAAEQAPAIKTQQPAAAAPGHHDNMHGTAPHAPEPAAGLQLDSAAQAALAGSAAPVQQPASKPDSGVHPAEEGLNASTTNWSLPDRVEEISTAYDSDTEMSLEEEELTTLQNSEQPEGRAEWAAEAGRAAEADTNNPATPADGSQQGEADPREARLAEQELAVGATQDEQLSGREEATPAAAERGEGELDSSNEGPWLPDDLDIPGFSASMGAEGWGTHKNDSRKAPEHDSAPLEDTIKSYKPGQPVVEVLAAPPDVAQLAATENMRRAEHDAALLQRKTELVLQGSCSDPELFALLKDLRPIASASRGVLRPGWAVSTACIIAWHMGLYAETLEYLHTLQTCKGLLPGDLGVSNTFTTHQQGLQELSAAMGHATSALDRHDVKGVEAAIKVLEQPTLAPLVSPGLRARALLLQAEALGTEASQPPPTAASEASAPVLRAFLATLQAVAICSGADILQQAVKLQATICPRMGAFRAWKDAAAFIGRLDPAGFGHVEQEVDVMCGAGSDRDWYHSPVDYLTALGWDGYDILVPRASFDTAATDFKNLWHRLSLKHVHPDKIGKRQVATLAFHETLPGGVGLVPEGAKVLEVGAIGLAQILLNGAKDIFMDHDAMLAHATALQTWSVPSVPSLGRFLKAVQAEAVALAAQSDREDAAEDLATALEKRARQVDITLAQLAVEEAWLTSVQAECLAEWLTYVGLSAYEHVITQIEACEDDMSQRVVVAAVLQTLIDCNSLPAKVLKDAYAVFGRQVEVEELVLLYQGVT